MAFCTKCGAKIPEGTYGAYCSACGHPIAQKVTSNTMANNTSVNDTPSKLVSKPKKSKGKMIGIIILCAVLIAALAVGGYLFFIKPGDKSFFEEGNKKEENYMSPLNTFIEAMADREDDIKVLRSYLYGEEFGALYLKFAEKEEELYGDESELPELYDRMKEMYGEDWELSFNTTKVDEIDFEDYAESFNFHFEVVMEGAEEYISLVQEVLKDEEQLESYADDYEVSVQDIKDYLNTGMKFLKAIREMEFNETYMVEGDFVYTINGETYDAGARLYFTKINDTWVYIGSDDPVSFAYDEEGVLRRLVNEAFINNGFLYNDFIVDGYLGM